MAVVARTQEKVTEGRVQKTLADWARDKGHELVVPNTSMATGWEADLICVTPRLLVHEFEIKVSRSDWLSERKAIEVGLGQRKGQRSSKVDRAILLSGRRERHHHSSIQIPNYWWVAAPEGVVREDELPNYAGLMLIYPGGLRQGLCMPRQYKAAPRLHRGKITTKQWRAMTRGLNHRYWNQ
jgi:hypothetical protein